MKPHIQSNTIELKIPAPLFLVICLMLLSLIPLERKKLKPETIQSLVQTKITLLKKLLSLDSVFMVF